MRRGLSIGRLIIGGAVFAISWIGYQLADVTDCSGPKANAWADNTIARLEEATFDYEEWDEFTTLATFGSYATRAHARYDAQLEEDTISCLDELQELTTEFFYDEWKMYIALSQGDYETAYQYDLASIEANEAMMRELDAMSAKYDWESE